MFVLFSLFVVSKHIFTFITQLKDDLHSKRFLPYRSFSDKSITKRAQLLIRKRKMSFIRLYYLPTMHFKQFYISQKLLCVCQQQLMLKLFLLYQHFQQYQTCLQIVLALLHLHLNLLGLIYVVQFFIVSFNIVFLN